MRKHLVLFSIALLFFSPGLSATTSPIRIYENEYWMDLFVKFRIVSETTSGYREIAAPISRCMDDHGETTDCRVEITLKNNDEDAYHINIYSTPPDDGITLIGRTKEDKNWDRDKELDNQSVMIKGKDTARIYVAFRPLYDQCEELQYIDGKYTGCTNTLMDILNIRFDVQKQKHDSKKSQAFVRVRHVASIIASGRKMETYAKPDFIREKPPTDTFYKPDVVVKNEGYRRVDRCQLWGKNCGKWGAFELCRDKGYETATKWEEEPDIGNTYIMREKKQCHYGHCDGFKEITCTTYTTYDSW